MELDFLDGQSPEPAAAPEVENKPETEGPARGPDGKFVSKEPEAPEPVTEAPAPVPEPPKPEGPPPGYVPVSVIQELRQELRALKQAPPPPPPDRYEDPEAFEQYQVQQVTAERFDWSKRYAEKEFGSETVEQAREWALELSNRDPIFFQRIHSSTDPYGLVMQEYQQAQAVQMFTDPKVREQFQAFLAQQTAQQAPAAQAAPPQPAPPPSIASAPSAGGLKPGHTPVGPGQAFDSIFK